MAILSFLSSVCVWVFICSSCRADYSGRENSEALRENTHGTRLPQSHSHEDRKEPKMEFVVLPTRSKPVVYYGSENARPPFDLSQSALVRKSQSSHSSLLLNSGRLTEVILPYSTTTSTSSSSLQPTFPTRPPTGSTSSTSSSSLQPTFPTRPPTGSTTSTSSSARTQPTMPPRPPTSTTSTEISTTTSTVSTQPTMTAPTTTTSLSSSSTTTTTGWESTTHHDIVFPATMHIMFVQDLSYSVKPFLGEIKDNLPETLDDLAAEVDNFHVGMASFVDKPMEPHGQADMDYCYRTDVQLLPFDESSKKQLEETLQKKILFRSGRDPKENQLGALVAAAQNIPSSPSSADPSPQSILVLATAALWHEEGDSQDLPPLPYSSFNRTAEEEEEEYCVSHDYPSRSYVRTVLQSVGANVLFLVEGVELEKSYRTLLRDLDVHGSVRRVQSSWSDFRQMFRAGIEDIVAQNNMYFSSSPDYL